MNGHKGGKQMKYAIVADYYMWNEEQGEHTEELYLGIEGKHKIFVFDKEVNKRTKLFKSASEAGRYIDERDSLNGKNMRMCFKSLKIVEVAA